jgi:hypothetical protein
VDKALFGKPVWLEIAQELVRFINRLRHKRTETGRPYISRVFPDEVHGPECWGVDATGTARLIISFFDDAVPGFGLRIRDGGYGSFSTSSERSSGASYWATQAR